MGKFLNILDLNTNRIINVGDPQSPQDAATMAWVQTQLGGQDWKNSVRAATTGALPTNTRASNVLTSTANAALPAQDGVSLSVNDSLLVKNEATGANNGVFTVTSLGSGSTPWVLTRRSDADTSLKVTAGFSVDVTEGATYADKAFTLTTDDPITLNTTSLVFSQGPSSSSYLAGSGLVLTGQTFSLDTTIAARRASSTIGDGSSTAVVFTHNLGNQFVSVQLFDAATNAKVEADVVLTSTNAVTISFSSAPALNAYRAVVIG